MADQASPQSGRSESLRLLAEDLVLELPAVDELLVDAARAAAGGMGLSCGITYVARYGVITVASSDEHAYAVDEIQYGLNVGPCLEALHTRAEVRVDDLRAETRWGGYPQLALRAGMRSSMSLPVLAGDQAAVGALNVYSTNVGPLPADQEAAAILATSQVGGILQSVRRTAAQLVADPDWVREFRARHELDIAVGVLMVQQDCAADEAAELLAQRARDQGSSVADIVARIIDSSGRKPGSTP
jgi:GAF domain-containing protein